MRTSDIDILMIPGWHGSGPEHWQSRWERNLKTAQRVAQEDWDAPDKDKWVGNIIKAVAATTRPAVLVAHSIGVIAVAHAARELPKGAVSGAFLVAAPDLDDTARWPVTEGYMWPETGFGFAPAPLAPLPFPSMLLASSDDPYCRPERARHLAAAWGAALVDVGPAGHISAESGYGPWPDGVLRFAKFLGDSTPEGSGLLASGLDLAHGLGQKLAHHLADLGIGNFDSPFVEVLANLTKNVVIALFRKVCSQDCLHVVGERGAHDSELGGRPLRKQLVALGLGPELKVLIERKFLLVGLLAIVEGRHVSSPPGGCGGGPAPGGARLHLRAGKTAVHGSHSPGAARRSMICRRALAMLVFLTILKIVSRPRFG